MIVDIRCYAILDPEHRREDDLAALARAAAAGGATLLQLRDKAGTTRDMVERARIVVAALAGTKVPVLVNDRVDVALAARAAGVHVGQDDMNPQDVRRLMGPDAIVGLTVKTEDQAMEVPVGLVDYVCIGGVFTTVSKHNPDPPVGLDGLSRLAERVRHKRGDLPVGAIAGIRADNAGEVIAAGADGVAVISEIFMAERPREAAERLRRAVDTALRERMEATS
ncbi:MAG: thiamine phosphate synthase [Phyllobacteriaceae bacterium]|nr:thiamine phosphate synthase [Phyllobacteriaceae bacterium]